MIHLTICSCRWRCEWEREDCTQCGGRGWMAFTDEDEQLNRQAAGEPQTKERKMIRFISNNSDFKTSTTPINTKGEDVTIYKGKVIKTTKTKGK